MEPRASSQVATHAEQLQQHASNYFTWRIGQMNNQPTFHSTKLDPNMDFMSQNTSQTQHSNISSHTGPLTCFTHDSAWDPVQAADWCAQIVCYLWYAKPSTLPKSEVEFPGQVESGCGFFDEPNSFISSQSMLYRQYGSAPPSSFMGKPIPSRTQLHPSEQFVQFVKNVLRMTQVSRSVVAIGLLYLYRLKRRHPSLEGQPGSEFRLFLTSLVLANKFLDDHTYTNKTWSEVSKIPLKEITKMESQLWGGIDTNASVKPEEYQWWLGALDRIDAQRSSELQWSSKMEATPVLSPCSSHSDASGTSSSRIISPPPIAWYDVQNPRITPLSPSPNVVDGVSRKRRRSNDLWEPIASKRSCSVGTSDTSLAGTCRVAHSSIPTPMQFAWPKANLSHQQLFSELDCYTHTGIAARRFDHVFANHAIATGRTRPMRSQSTRSTDSSNPVYPDSSLPPHGTAWANASSLPPSVPSSQYQSQLPLVYPNISNDLVGPSVDSTYQLSTVGQSQDTPAICTAGQSEPYQGVPAAGYFSHTNVPVGRFPDELQQNYVPNPLTSHLLDYCKPAPMMKSITPAPASLASWPIIPDLPHLYSSVPTIQDLNGANPFAFQARPCSWVCDSNTNQSTAKPSPSYSDLS